MKKKLSQTISVQGERAKKIVSTQFAGNNAGEVTGNDTQPRSSSEENFAND
jgi:hypothetical protein